MTNFKSVEKYFNGKGLANVQAALALLDQGLTDKRWPKGASRKVLAALNKLSGATKAIGKLADKIEQACEYEFKRGADDHRDHGPRAKWGVIDSALTYGSGRIDQLEESIAFLTKRLGKKMTADEKQVIDFAAGFAKDFKPVFQAIHYLNALRPAPVYTMGGTLSATVTKTVKEWGLNPTTVRMPKIKWEEFEYFDEKGRTCTKMIGTILWPANTKHHTSRFARMQGRAIFQQCEACGHAIQNPFNWVPLLLDDPKSVPHSYWVGRDCAKNLFGVDMTGEAEYSNREDKS